MSDERVGEKSGKKCSLTSPMTKQINDGIVSEIMANLKMIRNI